MTSGARVWAEEGCPMEPKTVQEPLRVMTAALSDVIAERARQVEAEGWTPEHDDKHKNGSMALAAACYAMSGSTLNDRTCSETVGALWPWTGWAWTWWKPSTPRRDLVKATSLLLAEIERRDRAEARKINDLTPGD